jgi:hypothetical protein
LSKSKFLSSSSVGTTWVFSAIPAEIVGVRGRKREKMSARAGDD